MPPELTVDFTSEDWARLRRSAGDRGYRVDESSQSLVDYVRDCALGKYEPTDASEGEHVRLAVLVFGLAIEAWAAAGLGSSGALSRGPYLDALRDVLATAADQGRLDNMRGAF